MASTARKKRSVITEVEQEYGEPFWKVVAGYAADGESAHSVAQILGYSGHAAFTRMCTRHNMRHLFPELRQSNGAKDRNRALTTAQLDALKAINARQHQARAVTVGGVTDTLSGHCRRHGFSLSTITSRIKAGLTLEQALKAPKYYAQRG